MFLLTTLVFPDPTSLTETHELCDIAAARDARLFTTPQAALAYAEKAAAAYDDEDAESEDERMRLVYESEEEGVTQWLFGARGSILALDGPGVFVWFWLRKVRVEA